MYTKDQVIMHVPKESIGLIPINPVLEVIKSNGPLLPCNGTVTPNPMESIKSPLSTEIYMPDVTPPCLDMPTPDGTINKSINFDFTEFMPNYLTPDLYITCATHSSDVTNGSIETDPAFLDTPTLNVKINEPINSDSQVILANNFAPDISSNTSNTNTVFIDGPLLQTKEPI